MKRISMDAKIDAYNVAIDALDLHESEYDKDGDYKLGREWLIKRLEKDLSKNIIK
jgi:hypothetical protein